MYHPQHKSHKIQSHKIQTTNKTKLLQVHCTTSSTTNLQHTNMKIKAASTTANISVASVALQAEIDECYQRLISGEIHFVSAATGACGHLGAKEMAVSVPSLL